MPLPSQPAVNHTIDATAAAAVVASWANVFAPVFNILVTLCAIGWYGVQFYEWWRKKKTAPKV